MNGKVVEWEASNGWMDCGLKATFKVIDPSHLTVKPAEGVALSLVRQDKMSRRGDKTEYMNFFMVEYAGLSKHTSGLFGNKLNNP